MPFSISRMWFFFVYLSIGVSAHAAEILYDSFDDATLEIVNGRERITTAAGVEWLRVTGELNDVELIPGGVRIDSQGGVATFLQPMSVDGFGINSRSGWSIKSFMSLSSGQYGGVGTNSLSYAALHGGRRSLVTGNFGNDTQTGPLDSVFGTEYYVQLDYFDDTLTGSVWPADNPAEIMSVSYDKGTTPTTPVLYTWHGVADFFDVRISSTPIPLPSGMIDAGDFDGDGILSVTDIDMLSNEIAAGPPFDLAFDMSGDGNVDDGDLTRWRSAAAIHNGFSEAYLLGDSNLNGLVAADDLNNLALNWRQETAKWTGGDFTADGVVNAADLNALALNWRQSIPMASAASAPVPEPSAFWLTLVGLISICTRRNGRHAGSSPCGPRTS